MRAVESDFRKRWADQAQVDNDRYLELSQKMKESAGSKDNEESLHKRDELLQKQQELMRVDLIQAGKTQKTQTLSIADRKALVLKMAHARMQKHSNKAIKKPLAPLPSLNLTANYHPRIASHTAAVAPAVATTAASVTQESVLQKASTGEYLPNRFPDEMRHNDPDANGLLVPLPPRPTTNLKVALICVWLGPLPKYIDYFIKSMHPNGALGVCPRILLLAFSSGARRKPMFWSVL
jgi:hypothetical protein